MFLPLPCVPGAHALGPRRAGSVPCRGGRVTEGRAQGHLRKTQVTVSSKQSRGSRRPERPGSTRPVNHRKSRRTGQGGGGAGTACSLPGPACRWKADLTKSLELGVHSPKETQ